MKDGRGKEGTMERRKEGRKEGRGKEGTMERMKEGIKVGMK